MTSVFFFNDTATPEIYTLSLHDALPICTAGPSAARRQARAADPSAPDHRTPHGAVQDAGASLLCYRRGRHERRSEEHTSELQSRQYLVCRLLLEKKTEKEYMLFY